MGVRVMRKSIKEPCYVHWGSVFTASCDNCQRLHPTPSRQAKSVGLKSLTQVSQITGVSLNTLTNWHRDKPELFRIVLLGVKADIEA